MLFTAIVLRIDAVRRLLAERRARPFVVAALAVASLAGAIIRYVYVLHVHHPRHYVLTDARQLTDHALRLVDSPTRQTILDTIWPPGAPTILAWLMAGDPTLGTAAMVQLLLSATLPLVVAHTAFLIAGPGAAWFALAAASLHFGFIHGAGFFLSETFFQFAIAASIWMATVTLIFDGTLDGGRLRPAAAAAVRGALGLAVGAGWGLATSVRPNALPVAAIVGAALAAHWLRSARARALWLLVGGAVALTLTLAPMADRCRALGGGGGCLVSANAAMNVALGQVDEAAGIEFSDPTRPELSTGWKPPGLLQHGYEGMLRVPHSIWDTGGIIRWIAGRTWQDLERSFLRSLRNAIDLFRVDFWPPDLGRWPVWPHVVSGWLVLLAVVLPALTMGYRLARAAARRPPRAPWPVFLAATVGAVVLVAAASIGEPRYRFPFDGALIVLAAVWLTGADIREPRVPTDRARRGLAAGLGLVGALSAVTVAAIAATGHPGSPPRLHAAELSPGAPPTLRDARERRGPVPPGTAWNAPGNHLFRCAPTCAELRLTSGAVEAPARVELTVDDNDVYRLTWYREGRPLGHVDIPRAAGSPGLRWVTVAPPPGAKDGYDALGVLPLFGDGAYALGHLRRVP